MTSTFVRLLLTAQVERPNRNDLIHGGVTYNVQESMKRVTALVGSCMYLNQLGKRNKSRIWVYTIDNGQGRVWNSILSRFATKLSLATRRIVKGLESSLTSPETIYSDLLEN